MKKLFGEILCLMLALALVCSFAACSKDEGDDKKVESSATQDNKKNEKEPGKIIETDIANDDEAAIEELVADAEAALHDGDISKFGEYFTGDEAPFDMSEFKTIVEGMCSETGLSEDEVMDIFSNVFESFELEISDIEVDGDAAEATMTMTVPDFEKFGDFDSMGEDVLMEYFEENGIDITDESYFNEMTEEDQLQMQQDMIVWMLEKIAEECGTVEETETVTFEKIDGDWKFVSE